MDIHKDTSINFKYGKHFIYIFLIVVPYNIMVSKFIKITNIISNVYFVSHGIDQSD